MRVVSRNVTATDLKGFENIGTSRDKVSLTKDGTLKAGNTWKGRLVSLLETVGIFKDYCTKAKLEMAEGNRHAAWTLWNGLVRKYGLDNAKEALSTTSPTMHGMDGVKVRHGIIRRDRMGDPGSLTCGEISLLMSRAQSVKRMRDQQMDNLQRQAPMPEHEAAYYNPVDTHTSGLSDAIQNHQRVKDFTGNRENLLFILREMKEDPSRLKQSRVDYVTSRLLQEVGAAKRDGVYTRDQIFRMAERALKESLQHKASWSRVQAMKIGASKRMGETTKFTQDIAALKDTVMKEAKATLSREYVQEVGHELGFPVRDSQAKKVAKDVLKQVEKRVTKDRIELKTEDFKEMTANALRERF